MSKPNKEIIIPDTEKIDHLAEEIKSILSEAVFSARMTLIEAKHLVGKTIVTNPLYQKNIKGSGEVIKDVATRIGRSERDIYLCVRFYQKFPEIDRCVQTLRGKKNDITWAAARRLLDDKEPEDCHHKWKEIKCWQCENCSQLRKTKP